MNMKLTRIAVSLICLLAFNICIHAQTLNNENLSNARVENISEDEIKAYYQKATNSGLSEDQVYQILSSKGLPQEELEKLKKRIASISLNSTTPGGPIKEKVVKVPVRTVNPDAASLPMQTFRKDSLFFGSELFSASSMVFEPNLRIATPSNYILGPDDEVIINVFGFSEQTYNLTVNQEGNIYIPNVGPVYVSGFSIEQAETKIKNKLTTTIYKAIRGGQTKVQISLGKIRSIRVTVIGEARKPGTYTVSSLTTLFNLLYLAGGPSEMGTFRNIELIRGNQIKRKIDIYNFLTKGDLKDNILLEELDVIRIPYYQTRVTLKGQVKRQGRFELQPGESFNQLLAYAGGFYDDAYRASVNVTQLTEKEKKIIDVPSSSFSTYTPASSDVITVGKIQNSYANRVSIYGSVFRPGDYEMEPDMTLKQLIEKAGGVKEDAFLQRGVISRLNADLSPASVSFGVAKIITGTEVIYLKKEDSITIGSKADMKGKMTVNIEGQVHKPGEFVWRENLSLKDVVFLAGGFSETANTVNIEVSRRVKDAKVGEVNFKQAEVIAVDLKDGLNGTGKDLVLEPFDLISVRSLPSYVKQRTVYIEGEVLSPGKYTLETNNDKLSDLVKRFGGFKSGADSGNITLKRVNNTGLSAEEKKDLFQRLLSVSEDSLQNNDILKKEIDKNFDIISINLQQALAEPTGTSNLLLEDGDYITVDRSSSLIRVGGAVYYPTLIPFQQGASMKYYLKSSGGYTENARKSSAIVLKPDGKAETVGKFLFFKSYPVVTPRSEIFVPTKNRNNRTRLSTGEWVAISSVFATLGTLLITAFKK
jgi:protein involved in polysaccharide export with SLBB domain